MNTGPLVLRSCILGLSLLLFPASLVISAHAEDTLTVIKEDHNVDVKEVRHGDVISLEYEMHDCSEATVTVTAELQNMDSSQPLPYTAKLSRKYGVLLSFTPQNPDTAWHYTWHYGWKYGQRMSGKPEFYAYSLPYRGIFPILQSPHGTFSHGPGSQNEEAIDWSMPIGTMIRAARAGTVIALRSECEGGGKDVKWKPNYNYIVIKHEDGTYAEYAHLRHNGVLVRLGEKIQQGQEIALSGDTGFATEPHLHFMVFDTLDGNTRETFPLTFRLIAE